MILYASYWKTKAENIYTVQITTSRCAKTLDKIKKEMTGWALTASGHSKNKYLLIYRKTFDSRRDWSKLKSKLSFFNVLEKVEG